MNGTPKRRKTPVRLADGGLNFKYAREEKPVKEEQKRERKLRISTLRLALAVTSFVVFMVAGVGAYYGAVGDFVTGDLASLYALLALAGSGAVLLGLWRFALPYYIGCGLGWLCGSYVAGLKGEFAPTAGGYTAAFCIILFALLGCLLQWRSLRKKWRKRREERAREKETAVELTSTAAKTEQPEEGPEGNGPES